MTSSGRTLARRALVAGAVVATLLALAAACTSPEPPKPLAASGDWSRVALGRRAPEASAHVESLTRIKAKNGLWLALGSTSDSPGALQKPGAWASSDDSNWQSIGIPIDAADTGSTVTATSDGTKGLIGGAVGTGRSAVPAVWTSTDAWSWSGPTTLPVPADAHGATVRSMSHGPGGWAAAGGATIGGDAGPLLWYSADGDTWNLADAGSLPRTHSAWSVAASGDRYVAVVSTNDLEHRAEQAGLLMLTSVDGKAWQSQSLSSVDKPIVSRSVVRVRDWFVAAIDCCGPDDQRHLAVSRDGSTWSVGVPSAPSDEFAVTTLTERQARLVAWAGADADMTAWQTEPNQDLGDGNAALAAAWHKIELPDPPRGTPYETAPSGYGTGRLATAGIGVVLMRPTTTKAYFFWTFDEKWGTALSDVPPPARQWSETVKGMAATDVVVAVGQATYTRLPGKTERPPEGRLWVSSGPLVYWDEVLVSSNITDLRGVATDGHRFVAIGTKGDTPLVFVSKTGRLWDELTDTNSSALMDLFDEPATTPFVLDEGKPVFDGEVPTSIIRIRDRYVVRTEAGHVWSSTDGARWTSATLPSPAGAKDLCASSELAFAPPYRSTDGEQWTIDHNLAASPFDPGGCAVSPSGDALFVNTERTSVGLLHGGLLQTNPFTLGVVRGLAWNGRWLALGSTTDDPAGDPAAWESTDGVKWQPRASVFELTREDGAGSLQTALTWDKRLLLGGANADAALVLTGPAG